MQRQEELIQIKEVIRIRKLLIFCVIVSLLLFGCTAETSEEEAGTCTVDDDCAGMTQECFEEGGEGLLGLTPFCIEGVCDCKCGHRDEQGNFVNDMCD